VSLDRLCSSDIYVSCPILSVDTADGGGGQSEKTFFFFFFFWFV